MNAPIQQDKNVGDPTSKYPDATDIPQVKMDGMQKPPETNPVVSAFETIMKYVKSLEDKKDPKAAPMKEHLTTLIQDVVGGAANGSEAATQQQNNKVASVQKSPEESGPGMAAKIGFDPYKDSSEDNAMGEDMSSEGANEAEMMKKKRMRKTSMQNSSITPLA